MGKEEMLGISIADAAKEAGVQVFIWCGLPNVEKLTGGKYVRRPLTLLQTPCLCAYNVCKHSFSKLPSARSYGLHVHSSDVLRLHDGPLSDNDNTVHD